MKEKRQKLICEIVSKREVTTQNDLQNILLEYGYKVTQATISRDIREMKLIKNLSKNGQYIYCLPEKSKGTVPNKKEYIILKGLISKIDYALNTVVIKCHVGMAQAVCASIDSMNFPDVVGTIAGDDTIFILMRSEQKAFEFVNNFGERFMTIRD
ncbi:MAG: arginine repressor [Ruminococcus sp.]|nr:arginine repressor [Ruminococcus sp.]